MLGSLDALFKLKKSWETFSLAHPGVAGFVKELGEREMSEGTLIELKVTYPDGRELDTNMRVGPEDLELISELGELMAKR